MRKSPTRTPAFLAANRANARKSTGPRTAAGRRRVSLNALRDGLRAHSLPRILRAGIPGEDVRHFARLRRFWMMMGAPLGLGAVRHFDLIAQSIWSQQRWIRETDKLLARREREKEQKEGISYFSTNKAGMSFRINKR